MEGNAHFVAFFPSLAETGRCSMASRKGVEMGESHSTTKIGDRIVGDGQPCYVVAEIGINHNGDVDLAKRLISVAVAAGCDAVKFQKRTIEVVYTPEELE